MEPKDAGRQTPARAAHASGGEMTQEEVTLNGGAASLMKVEGKQKILFLAQRLLGRDFTSAGWKRIEADVHRNKALPEVIFELSKMVKDSAEDPEAPVVPTSPERCTTVNSQASAEVDSFVTGNSIAAQSEDRDSNTDARLETSSETRESALDQAEERRCHPDHDRARVRSSVPARGPSDLSLRLQTEPNEPVSQPDAERTESGLGIPKELKDSVETNAESLSEKENSRSWVNATSLTHGAIDVRLPGAAFRGNERILVTTTKGTLSAPPISHRKRRLQETRRLVSQFCRSQTEHRKVKRLAVQSNCVLVDRRVNLQHNAQSNRGTDGEERGHQFPTQVFKESLGAQGWASRQVSSAQAGRSPLTATKESKDLLPAYLEEHRASAQYTIECSMDATVKRPPSFDALSTCPPLNTHSRKVSLAEGDDALCDSLFETGKGRKVSLRRRAVEEAKERLLMDDLAPDKVGTNEENNRCRYIGGYPPSSTLSSSSSSSAAAASSSKYISVSSSVASFSTSLSSSSPSPSSSSSSSSSPSPPSSSPLASSIPVILPSSLFQTARGSTVHISERKLEEARQNILIEGVSLRRTRQERDKFSPGKDSSGEGNTTTRSHQASERINPVAGPSIDGGSLFQTARGERVVISRRNLEMARKNISDQDSANTEGMSLSRTIACEGEKKRKHGIENIGFMSDKSICRERSELRETERLSDKAVLLARSGKSSLTKSSKKEAATGDSASESFIKSVGSSGRRSPPASTFVSLFQTAKGDSVIIQMEKVKQAERKFAESTKAEETTKSKSRLPSAVTKERCTEAEKATGSTGSCENLFCTTRGGMVKIARESLNKAIRTFDEECDTKYVLHANRRFPGMRTLDCTQSEQDTIASSGGLLPEKCELSCLESETMPKPRVTVSDSALQGVSGSSGPLLQRNPSETSSTSVLSTFSTARETSVLLSEKQIQDAENVMNRAVECVGPSRELGKVTGEAERRSGFRNSLFQTGRGRPVQVSQSLLDDAVRSFQLDTDEVNGRNKGQYTRYGSTTLELTPNAICTTKEYSNETTLKFSIDSAGDKSHEVIEDSSVNVGTATKYSNGAMLQQSVDLAIDESHEVKESSAVSARKEKSADITDYGKKPSSPPQVGTSRDRPTPPASLFSTARGRSIRFSRKQLEDAERSVAAGINAQISVRSASKLQRRPVETRLTEDGYEVGSKKVMVGNSDSITSRDKELDAKAPIRPTVDTELLGSSDSVPSLFATARGRSIGFSRGQLEHAERCLSMAWVTQDGSQIQDVSNLPPEHSKELKMDDVLGDVSNKTKMHNDHSITSLEFAGRGDENPGFKTPLGRTVNTQPLGITNSVPSLFSTARGQKIEFSQKQLEDAETFMSATMDEQGEGQAHSSSSRVRPRSVEREREPNDLPEDDSNKESIGGMDNVDPVNPVVAGEGREPALETFGGGIVATKASESSETYRFSSDSLDGLLGESWPSPVKTRPTKPISPSRPTLTERMSVGPCLIPTRARPSPQKIPAETTLTFPGPKDRGSASGGLLSYDAEPGRGSRDMASPSFSRQPATPTTENCESHKTPHQPRIRQVTSTVIHRTPRLRRFSVPMTNSLDESQGEPKGIVSSLEHSSDAVMSEVKYFRGSDGGTKGSRPITGSSRLDSDNNTGSGLLNRTNKPGPVAISCRPWPAQARSEAQSLTTCPQPGNTASMSMSITTPVRSSLGRPRAPSSSAFKAPEPVVSLPLHTTPQWRKRRPGNISDPRENSQATFSRPPPSRKHARRLDETMNRRRSSELRLQASIGGVSWAAKVTEQERQSLVLEKQRSKLPDRMTTSINSRSRETFSKSNNTDLHPVEGRNWSPETRSTLSLHSPSLLHTWIEQKDRMATRPTTTREAVLCGVHRVVARVSRGNAERICFGEHGKPIGWCSADLNSVASCTDRFLDLFGLVEAKSQRCIYHVYHKVLKSFQGGSVDGQARNISSLLAKLTPAWTRRHFALIVWKYASMERRMTAMHGKLLTFDRVLHKLRQRAELEMKQGVASISPLYRIIVGSEPSKRLVTLMVTEVVAVKSTPSTGNKACEGKGEQAGTSVLKEQRAVPTDCETRSLLVTLSDGYVEAPARIDQGLTSLVRLGKIKEGTKLCIGGAERELNPIEKRGVADAGKHSYAAEEARGLSIVEKDLAGTTQTRALADIERQGLSNDDRRLLTVWQSHTKVVRDEHLPAHASTATRNPSSLSEQLNSVFQNEDGDLNFRLVLNYNGVRRAHWAARLGFDRHRQFLSVPLRSIREGGGQIPCLQVMVVRKYPLMYLRQLSNGSRVVLSAEEEESLRERLRRKAQEHAEKALEVVQADVERHTEEYREDGERQRRANTDKCANPGDSEENEERRARKKTNRSSSRADHYNNDPAWDLGKSAKNRAGLLSRLRDKVEDSLQISLSPEDSLDASGAKFVGKVGRAAARKHVPDLECSSTPFLRLLVCDYESASDSRIVAGPSKVEKTPFRGRRRSTSPLKLDIARELSLEEYDSKTTSREGGRGNGGTAQDQKKIARCMATLQTTSGGTGTESDGSCPRGQLAPEFDKEAEGGQIPNKIRGEDGDNVKVQVDSAFEHSPVFVETSPTPFSVNISANKVKTHLTTVARYAECTLWRPSTDLVEELQEGDWMLLVNTLLSKSFTKHPVHKRELHDGPTAASGGSFAASTMDHAYNTDASSVLRLETTRGTSYFRLKPSEDNDSSYCHGDAFTPSLHSDKKARTMHHRAATSVKNLCSGARKREKGSEEDRNVVGKLYQTPLVRRTGRAGPSPRSQPRPITPAERRCHLSPRFSLNNGDIGRASVIHGTDEDGIEDTFDAAKAEDVFSGLSQESVARMDETFNIDSGDSRFSKESETSLNAIFRTIDRGQDFDAAVVAIAEGPWREQTYTKRAKSQRQSSNHGGCAGAASPSEKRSESTYFSRLLFVTDQSGAVCCVERKLSGSIYEKRCSRIASDEATKAQLQSECVYGSSPVNDQMHSSSIAEVIHASGPFSATSPTFAGRNRRNGLATGCRLSCAVTPHSSGSSVLPLPTETEQRTILLLRHLRYEYYDQGLGLHKVTWNEYTEVLHTEFPDIDDSQTSATVTAVVAAAAGDTFTRCTFTPKSMLQREAMERRTEETPFCSPPAHVKSVERAEVSETRGRQSEKNLVVTEGVRQSLPGTERNSAILEKNSAGTEKTSAGRFTTPRVSRKSTYASSSSHRRPNSVGATLDRHSKRGKAKATTSYLLGRVKELQRWSASDVGSAFLGASERNIEAILGPRVTVRSRKSQPSKLEAPRVPSSFLSLFAEALRTSVEKKRSINNGTNCLPDSSGKRARTAKHASDLGTESCSARPQLYKDLECFVEEMSGHTEGLNYTSSHENTMCHTAKLIVKAVGACQTDFLSISSLSTVVCQTCSQSSTESSSCSRAIHLTSRVSLNAKGTSGKPSGVYKSCVLPPETKAQRVSKAECLELIPCVGQATELPRTKSVAENHREGKMKEQGGKPHEESPQMLHRDGKNLFEASPVSNDEQGEDRVSHKESERRGEAIFVGDTAGMGSQDPPKNVENTAEYPPRARVEVERLFHSARSTHDDSYELKPVNEMVTTFSILGGSLEESNAPTLFIGDDGANVHVMPQDLVQSKFRMSREGRLEEWLEIVNSGEEEAKRIRRSSQCSATDVLGLGKQAKADRMGTEQEPFGNAIQLEGEGGQADESGLGLNATYPAKSEEEEERNVQEEYSTDKLPAPVDEEATRLRILSLLLKLEGSVHGSIA